MADKTTRINFSGIPSEENLSILNDLAKSFSAEDQKKLLMKKDTIKVDKNTVFDRRKFLDHYRQTLPSYMRDASDNAIMSAVFRKHPELQQADWIDSTPELPSRDRGFVESFYQPTKDFVYRLPETAVSTMLNVATAAGLEPTEKAYNLFESIHGFTQQLEKEDAELRSWKKWAGENPFEWGRSFEGGMIGRALSSAITSMGIVVGSAALGAAMGGPVGSMAGAMGAAFSLEGSEAFAETWDILKERGYTNKEAGDIAAESGLTYGIISSVLESLVPYKVGKALGIGSFLAKSVRKGAGKEIIESQMKQFTKEYAKAALSNGPISETAQKAMSELLKKNLSYFGKIKHILKTMAPNMVEEALTEGSQFLAQKAVVESKTDNTDWLDWNWVKEKMADPEFSESMYGGLWGGGVFSSIGAYTNISGKRGKKAAEEIKHIYDNFGHGVVQETMALQILNNTIDETYTKKEQLEPFVAFLEKEGVGISDLIDKKKGKVIYNPATKQKIKDKYYNLLKDNMRDITVRQKVDEFIDSENFSEVDKTLFAQTLGFLANKGLLEKEVTEPTTQEKAKKGKAEEERVIKKEAVIGNKPEEKPAQKEEVPPTPTEQSTTVESVKQEPVAEEETKPAKKGITQQEFDALSEEEKEKVVERLPDSHPIVMNYTYGRTGGGQYSGTNQPDKPYSQMSEKEQKKHDVVVNAFKGFPFTSGVGKKASEIVQSFAGTRNAIQVGEQITKQWIDNINTNLKEMEEKGISIKSYKNNYNNNVSTEDGGKAKYNKTKQIFHLLKNTSRVLNKEIPEVDMKKSEKPVQQQTPVSELPDSPKMTTDEQTGKPIVDIRALPEDIAKELRSMAIKAVGSPEPFDINAAYKQIIAQRKAAETTPTTTAKVTTGNVGEVKTINVPGYGVKTFEEAMELQARFARNRDEAKTEATKQKWNKKFEDLYRQMQDVEWHPKDEEEQAWREEQQSEKTLSALESGDADIAAAEANFIGNADDGVPFQKTTSLEPVVLSKEQKQLVSNISKKLKAAYPQINVKAVEGLLSIKRSGDVAVGAAIGDTVLWSKTHGTPDTLPHEYFHIYAAMMKDSPIMKLGIKQFGGEENLTQAVGEYYVNRESMDKTLRNRIKVWLKTFTAYLKKMFNKLSDDDVVQLIGEKFYQGKYLTGPKEVDSTISFKLKTDPNRYGVNLIEMKRSNLSNNKGDVADNIPFKDLIQFKTVEGKANETQTAGDNENSGVEQKFYVDFMANYLTRKEQAEISDVAKSAKNDEDFIKKMVQHVDKKKAEDIKNKVEDSKWDKRFSNEDQDKLRLYYLGHNNNIFRFDGDDMQNPKFFQEAVRGIWRLILNKQGKVHRNSLDFANLIDPRTGKQYSSNLHKNYIEDDGIIYTVLPMEEVLKKVEKDGNVYYFDGNLDLSAGMLKELENLFITGYINRKNQFHPEKNKKGYKGKTYGKLRIIVGSRGGSGSAIVLTTVPDKFLNMTKEQFEAFAVNEFVKGNITEEQKDRWLNDLNGYVDENKNPIWYSIEATRHEYYQSILYPEYAHEDNFKSLENFFDRWGIIQAEGGVPKGMDNHLKESGIEKNQAVLLPSNFFVKHNGKIMTYADFDGVMFTSEAVFDALDKTIGRKKTSVIKMFMRRRDVDPDGRVHFLGSKMSNQTPFKGMRFYKTREDAENDNPIIIAKEDLDLGKVRFWHVKDEKFFDNVLSDNEAKLTSGKYRDSVMLGDTNIFDLNEKDFKIIKTIDRKFDAPMPFRLPEYMLTKATMDNPIVQKLDKEYKKYYKNILDDYFDILLGLITNPEKLIELRQRELQDGELPSELDIYMKADPTGKMLLHPSIISQLTPYLYNKLIISGAFKGRDRGNGSVMVFKPEAGLDVGRNEFKVSSQSSVVHLVLEKMGKKKKGEKAPPITVSLVKEINKWLSKNDFKMVVHRQPISKVTGVRVMKLTEVVTGRHGQVVFHNAQDIKEVFDGDYDIDTGNYQIVPDSLSKALEDFQNSKEYADMDKVVILDISSRKMDKKPLETGAKKPTILNRGDLHRAMIRNAQSNSYIGLLASYIYAHKNMEIKNLSFKYKGKTYTIRESNSAYNFALLDDAETKQIMLDEWDTIHRGGDHIIDGDGNVVTQDTLAEAKNLKLVTTFQHRNSILFQAAVDHAKYKLLSDLGFSPEGFLRTLFLADGETIKTTEYKEKLPDILKTITGYFNTGSLRQGRQYGKHIDMQDMIETLRKFQSEMDMTVEERANAALNTMYDHVSKNIKMELLGGEISELSFDNTMNATESLYYEAGKRLNEFYEKMGIDEKHKWISGYPYTYDKDINKVSHFLAMAGNRVPKNAFPSLIDYVEKKVNKLTLNDKMELQKFANEMVETWNLVLDSRSESDRDKLVVDKQRASLEIQQWIDDNLELYNKKVKTKQQKIYFTVNFLRGLKSTNGSYTIQVQKLWPPEFLDIKTVVEYNNLRMKNLEWLKENPSHIIKWLDDTVKMSNRYKDIPMYAEMYSIDNKLMKEINEKATC